MVTERILHMTVADYLAFEQESDIKHEYIDGEIYPMTGGTLTHSAISINTIIALGNRLSASTCQVHSSDMRIRVSPSRYVYPDLSVVCGEAATDDQSMTLLNPILIAEVTSPSSIDYDRVIKRDYYEMVRSIQAYLVIDQHRVLVELYMRREGGWFLQRFSDLDAAVPLAPLDCDLPLADIYHGIQFEEEDPASAE